MKRWKSCLIVLVFIALTVFGMQTVFADETGKCGDNLTWKLDDAGNLIISGKGDMADYINESGIVSPFYDRGDIKSVTIENGVTRIGNGTFERCINLTNIRIPSSVTSIGYAAFNVCSSLMSITIPNSVTNIESFAFYNCSNLTNIAIPSSVTSIKPAVFCNCSSLTSITIPSSVTSIGGSAFSGCSSLMSITIPSSVTSIGSAAFCDCRSLMSITIPSSVTSIESRSFYCCYSLTSITIPSSVTSIGESAFSECAMKSIMIPDSVTNIGSRSFDHCHSLASVTIPSSVISIGEEAFYNCAYLKSIMIPSSVTSIGTEAFALCYGLTDIYYSGSEEQWNQIEFGENIFVEGVTIHYNANNSGNNDNSNGDNNSENDENSDYIGFHEEKFDTYLSDPATVFNVDLALISADLSLASYNPINNDSGVRSYLRKLGFENADMISNNYGGSLAYTIGVKPYSKDPSGATGVMVVVAQGSTNAYELIKDATAWPAPAALDGYLIYDIVYDFYTDIQRSMSKMLEKYKYKRYKFLATGHSLGGAVANLFSAAITNTSGNEKKDNFCYTFGAVNCIKSSDLVSSGYENIHNVYNLLDTFSPYQYGGWLPTGMGGGFGKFGVMDWFGADYRDVNQRSENPISQIASHINHDMDKYREAMVKALNNRLYFSLGAKDKSFNGTLQFIDFGPDAVVSFACPVDIDVYTQNKLVGRVVNGKVDREVSSINILVIDDVKYLFLNNDSVYDIKISSYGSGTMSVTTQNLVDRDEGGNVYKDISLKKGKNFVSSYGGDITASEVKVYVVDDSFNMVSEVNKDGTEKCIHVMTRVDAKPATSTEDGNIEYWKCSYCGMLFKDSEGKNEILVSDIVIPKNQESSGNSGSQTGESIEQSGGSQIGWNTQPNDGGQTGGTTEENSGGQTDGGAQPVTEAQPVIPESVQEPITISITPSSVKVKVKKNRVTVSWKKVRKKLLSKVKNIQIQYSTDPTFNQNPVTKTIGKNKTEVVLKLKKKTTYYIRLRYVGKDGFSNWSKVKKVKMK